MSELTPFGTLTAPRPGGGEINRERFRLAILGDFSGRAARGLMEVGDDLAKRRAIKLDVDTIEDVIQGFATTLVLPIGKNEAGIEIELNELEDLEPDELYDNVELFSELSGLRQQLGNASMAGRAIETIKSWASDHSAQPLIPKRSMSTAVPADRKLTDFQSLIGGSVGPKTEATAAHELIGRIVGPYMEPGTDPEAEAMKALVDEALSGAMRLVLHHPDFQAVEQQWRTIDFLARRIETDGDIEIVLYDISAEELATDLASAEELGETGLCKLFSEAADDPREAYSAIFGLYTFEETPPHAHLLGRMARLAAHVDAPFFSAMSPSFMETPLKDRHPLIAEAWDALRALPEAGWLGLASPRFLLRRPYGQKTEPIYAFKFEEFTAREGLSGLLWANPVAAVAVLLAQTRTQGKDAMKLGTVLTLPEMPFHFFNDAHGDQVALPCTERNLTTVKMEQVVKRGFMPIISLKGRDVIRLGSFQSMAGKKIRGPWSKGPAPEPSPATPAATFTATIPKAPPEAEAPAPAPAPEPVEEVKVDDVLDDLDALLAETEPEPAEESSDVMDDLDALLAEFDTEDSAEAGGGEDDIDAELAALLDDL